MQNLWHFHTVSLSWPDSDYWNNEPLKKNNPKAWQTTTLFEWQYTKIHTNTRINEAIKSADTNILCWCSAEANYSPKLKNWIRLQRLQYKTHYYMMTIENQTYSAHLNYTQKHFSTIHGSNIGTHTERLLSLWQFYRSLDLAGNNLQAQQHSEGIIHQQKKFTNKSSRIMWLTDTDILCIRQFPQTTTWIFMKLKPYQQQISSQIGFILKRFSCR